MSRPRVVQATRSASSILSVGDCCDEVEEVVGDLDHVAAVLEFLISRVPEVSFEEALLVLMEEKLHAIARQLEATSTALCEHGRQAGGT